MLFLSVRQFHKVIFKTSVSHQPLNILSDVGTFILSLMLPVPEQSTAEWALRWCCRQWGPPRACACRDSPSPCFPVCRMGAYGSYLKSCCAWHIVSAFCLSSSYCQSCSGGSGATVSFRGPHDLTSQGCKGPCLSPALQPGGWGKGSRSLTTAGEGGRGSESCVGAPELQTDVAVSIRSRGFGLRPRSSRLGIGSRRRRSGSKFRVSAPGLRIGIQGRGPGLTPWSPGSGIGVPRSSPVSRLRSRGSGSGMEARGATLNPAGGRGGPAPRAPGGRRP